MFKFQVTISETENGTPVKVPVLDTTSSAALTNMVSQGQLQVNINGLSIVNGLAVNQVCHNNVFSFEYFEIIFFFCRKLFVSRQ